ncbi:nucleotide sugar dehydrogenase [Sutcliffiella horikoshii]|uniref:Nucleotide sugar dehydrogenase n=1 Tax=Sutcliffiella horikoshii TaxID=79883 RepID=A0AA95B8S0_9BACI|nr:nucleotide sugar dehydrogenase [Sutcliffiella horikoshii]TYS61116.1 nucleotide sugar dehydrogenase [Sutcliffiella horikoshii]
MRENQTDKFRIAIIGLGYVGLPLAILFQSKGFDVLGIDNSMEKIESIRLGKSYLSDFTDEEVKSLSKSINFNISTTYEGIRDVDVCILCVPTPLNHQFEPDMQYIESAIDSIFPYLGNGKLIVLESSTYPGTTEQFVLPKLIEKGLEMEADFHLGYSPERIDPGNTSYELKRIPKIISGVTEGCKQKIDKLYSQVFDRTVLVSSPVVAEMTKLLENTQRFINISFINEMAILCNSLKINIWEVLEAAGTKPFGFTKYSPGPGIGGHCIPVDPLYLSWKAAQQGLGSKFIDLSKEINDQMPHYVINRLRELLKMNKQSLSNEKKILVVGLTYKKDVNDVRESTALSIFKNLLKEFDNVHYYDPYIPDIKIKGRNYKSISIANENLQEYDCVVILTNHSNIDYQYLVDHSTLIFDTRNEIQGENPNVITL